MTFHRYPNAKSRPSHRPVRLDRGVGQMTQLDYRNEGFEEKEMYLHPTKGFRKASGKASQAAIITQDIKQGNGRGWTMKAIKEALAQFNMS